MKLRRHAVVSAVFRPKRVDDLREGVAAYIGQRLRWTAAWIIEDGPYEGQFAMAVLEPTPPFAWVPECDLDEIEETTA